MTTTNRATSWRDWRANQ